MFNSLDRLELRLLFASTHFAVIGDFGTVSQGAADVADLVHRRDPDFILTVGDNNYPAGDRETLDNHVGRYYHDFIHPYTGKFGAGSLTGENRFFPVLGNHDYETDDGRPHIDYFELPGNERYYTFKRGPVQFFAIDSDPRAADLGYVNDDTSTARSVQGRWLKRALAKSTAKYKIVYLHHAPYNSGAHHGSSRFMQWPFRAWGATAVLAGHEHVYERFDKQGTPFFVNGLGGRSFREFSDTRLGGSRVQFTGDYGAMFVNADEKRIVFKFITADGDVIDRHRVTAIPAAPTKLASSSASSGGVQVTWRDGSPNETAFKVQRSIGGGKFQTIARIEENSTFFLDRSATPDAIYAYRVRAMNAFGSSKWATA
jgi:hypothetical protein